MHFDRVSPQSQEATIARIRYFEYQMTAGAPRIHAAGWGGVEVAADMSYFLSIFLSPRKNWRADEYRGSMRDRARVLYCIVDGTCSAVGPDFAIGLRITANGHVADGQGSAAFTEITR